MSRDFRVDARFLASFPNGGDFRLLARLDQAFRQLPASLGTNGDDCDFNPPSVSGAAEYHPARGCLISDRYLDRGGFSGWRHGLWPWAYRSRHTSTLSRTWRVSILFILPGRFSIEMG